MSADCVCVLTAVYSFDRVLTVFDLVDGESGMIIVFRKANFHGSEIDFLREKRIVAGVWGIGKGGCGVRNKGSTDFSSTPGTCKSFRSLFTHGYCLP